MINNVTLTGRLTRDPELRYTPTGIAVAQFILAVNRPFTNQDGQRDADFIYCVAWRNLAENVANYLKKGSLIGIEGRLQTRNYDNQSGQRVYVTEVIVNRLHFLDTRNNQNGVQNNNQSNKLKQEKQMRIHQEDYDPFEDYGSPIDISDDDLPF